MKAWKAYDIVDCILNVKKALHDLTPTLLNNCWRKLWPTIVKNKAEIHVDLLGIENERIIQIGKQIGGDGFNNLDEEDIEGTMLEDELNERELLAIDINGNKDSQGLEISEPNESSDEPEQEITISNIKS